MKVSKAQIKNIRLSGLDIKISNGLRDFMVTIDKRDLTYEKLINYDKEQDIKIKIYSMIRNCCAAYPIIVLEKGKSKGEDEELKDVMNTIFNILGHELKDKLKSTCTE